MKFIYLYYSLNEFLNLCNFKNHLPSIKLFPNVVGPQFEVKQNISLKKDNVFKNNIFAKNFRKRSKSFTNVISTQVVSLNHHIIENEVFENEISKKSGFLLSDFNFEAKIGTGGFGECYLVTAKTNNKECFAMKVLSKYTLFIKDEIESFFIERDVCKLGNRTRFIVKLISCFQNKVIFLIIVTFFKLF